MGSELHCFNENPDEVIKSLLVDVHDGIFSKATQMWKLLTMSRSGDKSLLQNSNCCGSNLIVYRE